jgi:hypothetical protein
LETDIAFLFFADKKGLRRAVRRCRTRARERVEKSRGGLRESVQPSGISAAPTKGLRSTLLFFSVNRGGFIERPSMPELALQDFDG